MHEGLTAITIAAAFGAGLVSVLSPCVMPLMPAYLSLISGVTVEELRHDESRAGLRRRVLLGCTGFVGGFSTVFVLLGASATTLGHWLQAWRLQIGGVSIGVAQLAGLVIVAMGLHLLGWLKIPAFYRDARFRGPLKPRSWVGTFLVGAAFAFGWSPCVGPILGGILTLAASRETVGQGMSLLAVYSLGLGVPFFLAGWSIEFFLRALDRMKGWFHVVEVASGALLVGLGLLVVTDRLTILNSYFGFLNHLVGAAQRWLL